MGKHATFCPLTLEKDPLKEWFRQKPENFESDNKLGDITIQSILLAVCWLIEICIGWCFCPTNYEGDGIEAVLARIVT